MDGTATDGLISARSALVLIGVVGVSWNLLGNLALPSEWYVPANLVVGALAVGIARSAGVAWGDLGLSNQGLTRGLVVGLAAAAVVAVAIAVLVAVPWTRAFFQSEVVDGADDAGRWYHVVVRIPFGTAVFEELLFRSALLGVLMRIRPMRTAVATSAAAFGLWHVVPAWETADGSGWAVTGAIVGTVAVTALAGLLFAGLRVRAGSVVAPILAHTATNSLAYVAAWTS